MVGPVTGISAMNSKALIEEGQQYVTRRIPPQIERLADGTPRMGYESLPADYAYKEYVESQSAQAMAGNVTALGQKIDIFA